MVRIREIEYALPMIPITRIGTSRLSNTRSRSIAFNGVMTTVAVASDTRQPLYEQAQQALAVLDDNLAEAGTGKFRILMVMIYLANIDAKPAFNRAWDAWVDRDNLPLRACVGAPLEGDFLVEIVATAAVDT
jgi:enamine deaminase RidA (YjgF/YER057c/UK114 family)